MKEYEELYKQAKEARLRAYAPYSNFKVGAAILTDDGKIITGCNIENASFPLTVCGERNAMFSAYANGYQKENIKALLITADTKDVVSPCGACRQVMSELLDKDCPIILTNINGLMKVYSIKDLLPFSFVAGDMENA